MQKNQTNNQDLAPAMAPGQFRIILKKHQATSAKLQAPSCKPRPALIRTQLNDSRIIKEKDYENIYL